MADLRRESGPPAGGLIWTVVLATAVLLHAISAALLPPARASAPMPEPVASAAPAPRIHWGARADGDVYGRSADAPWDFGTWDLFEQHATKKASVLHFGQPAPWVQSFNRGPLDLVTSRGAIPMMTMDTGTALLSDIAAGRYDTALTAWAQAAKSYGKPFFLRWNWEMNGTWYSWGQQARANPANYVGAWRRFHDIVTRVGATNVTWVWCPNKIWSTSTPLSSLYPGDAYVDWTAFDAYNRAALYGDGWESANTVYKATYNALVALSPNKPIMIAETASTELGAPAGTSKAAWITDMLATQLPQQFPKVKAMIWFNWNIFEAGSVNDWPIESSTASQRAFGDAIRSPYYASNTFGSLPALTKVPLP